MGAIDRRVGLLLGVFVLCLCAAFARAGWLGVVRASDLKAAASTQQEAVLSVPARRGTITDAHDTVLAVSEPATTVTATPYLVEDAARAAAKLAPLLQKPEDELLRSLSRRDTGFVYLARRVPAARAAKVRKLEIEGLDFVEEYRRTYPRGWNASQVIGTVGNEGRGLAGLEYSLDESLTGRDGRRRLVKDGTGAPVVLRDPQPARAGQDVRLTIDSAIQEHTEEVLADIGRDWSPKGATALVMDPRDGSILALANWPRVDANALGDAPDFAKQNRAVSAAYEPGSTFKAFTVASALEDGKVEPDTMFPLPPTLQVADRTIKESHERGFETMSTARILAESSNVGAVKIGLLQGRNRFHHWLGRFGFGRETGVDMPGESKGIVLPLDDYSDSTMGNLPIGQGIAVTPIQMAAAYAAIANGGILRPPHVVAEVGGKPTEVPEGRRVISESTANEVARMLEGVFGPGGTASGADVKGYNLAGKTGTAQKPDPVNGGYYADKYVASFVGFAPARDPRLLVTVMVDEPRGEYYGGLIAAPAFQKITSFALNYLRIPPE
jgi:cell division protein FtsI (penicillin-binding protein 3)